MTRSWLGVLLLVAAVPCLGLALGTWAATALSGESTSLVEWLTEPLLLLGVGGALAALTGWAWTLVEQRRAGLSRGAAATLAGLMALLALPVLAAVLVATAHLGGGSWGATAAAGLCLALPAALVTDLLGRRVVS